MKTQITSSPAKYLDPDRLIQLGSKNPFPFAWWRIPGEQHSNFAIDLRPEENQDWAELNRRIQDF
jgi:hypothetical protein